MQTQKDKLQTDVVALSICQMNFETEFNNIQKKSQIRIEAEITPTTE